MTDLFYSFLIYDVPVSFTAVQSVLLKPCCNITWELISHYIFLHICASESIYVYVATFCSIFLYQFP